MFFITDAYAQGGPAGESGWTMPIVMLAAMALLYFMTIRPQAKRAKEVKAMIDALAKGDEVVTTGGLMGRVVELAEQYVTLQVSSVADRAVQLQVQRSAIQTLLPRGTMGTMGTMGNMGAPASGGAATSSGHASGSGNLKAR